MPTKRIAIHTVFVLLMPLIVAGFGLSFPGALLLVVVALAWRWAITLLAIARPSDGPELVLETIAASHFVEKVRWCMDRLGLAYTEKPWGGTLGAFFRGRTVPRLYVRSDVGYSAIGNSPHILRYLWGAFAAEKGDSAGFLEPTPERLEFERRIDRCGRNLQVWVYYHILSEPALCKSVWGANHPATPWWQRKLVVLLFPVQAFLISKSFATNETHYRKCCQHIEALLAEVEEMLADGRGSILGGDEINYSDLAFAAIQGIWLQPEEYGGGAGIRVERALAPKAMQDDIERWIGKFPRVTTFVTRLYAEQRKPREAL